MIAPVVKIFDHIASRLSAPCAAGFCNERGGAGYAITGEVAQFFDERLGYFQSISSRTDKHGIGVSVQMVKPFDGAKSDSQYIYALFGAENDNYLVKIRFVDSTRGGILNYFLFYPINVEAIDSLLTESFEGARHDNYAMWLSSLWGLVSQNSYVINKQANMSVLYLNYENPQFLLLMIRTILSTKLVGDGSFLLLQLEREGILNPGSVPAELLTLLHGLKSTVEFLNNANEAAEWWMPSGLLESKRYQTLAGINYAFPFPKTMQVNSLVNEVQKNDNFRDILRTALLHYFQYLSCKCLELPSEDPHLNELRALRAWSALHYFSIARYSNDLAIDDAEILYCALEVLE